MEKQNALQKVISVSEIASEQITRLKNVLVQDKSVPESIRGEAALLAKTAHALNESVKLLISEASKAIQVANHNYSAAYVLKEQLSFYANEENWKSSGRKKSAAALDAGEKARLVLKSNDKNTTNE